MRRISFVLSIVLLAGCAGTPSPTGAAGSGTPEFDSEIVVDGGKLPRYKDVRPEAIFPPVYPAQDLDRRRTGEVAVGAVIESDGRVSATFVFAAQATVEMQKAAKAAVLQWRFRPILKNGVAIRYVTVIPVQFSL